MPESRKSEQIKKAQEFEFDTDEKMNHIIYELKLLILNVMIDVLEKLNVTNEDQMQQQTTFTCT